MEKGWKTETKVKDGQSNGNGIVYSTTIPDDGKVFRLEVRYIRNYIILIGVAHCGVVVAHIGHEEKFSLPAVCLEGELHG